MFSYTFWFALLKLQWVKWVGIPYALYYFESLMILLQPSIHEVESSVCWTGWKLEGVMEMTILFSLAFLTMCMLWYLYYNQKKMLESYRANALDAFSSHEDMKETLRIGLYNRFKRDLEQQKEEDPLVGRVMAAAFGSAAREYC